MGPIGKTLAVVAAGAVGALAGAGGAAAGPLPAAGHAADLRGMAAPVVTVGGYEFVARAPGTGNLVALPPNRFYAPPPARRLYVAPGPFYDPGRIVIYEGVTDPVFADPRRGANARWWAYPGAGRTRVVIETDPNRGGVRSPPGPSLAPSDPVGCFDGPGGRVECPPFRAGGW